MKVVNIKAQALLFFYNVVLTVIFSLRLTFLLISFRWRSLRNVIKTNFGFYGNATKITVTTKCKTESPDKQNKQQCIWFHAASVGESLLAFPLVKKLLQKNLNYPIVITTCTESSKKLWLNEFNNKIIYRCLPWDLKFFANRFIESFNPKLVIYMEADFWPNFLFSLKQKKIPTLLLNGRMSKKSFKRWLKIKFFMVAILNSFTFLSANSLSSKKYMEHFVGKNKVSYFGNLKYVINKKALNINEVQQLQKSVVQRIGLLALSTHKPEELMLAKIHLELKKVIPSLLTIIIPRHVERTKGIVAALKAMPVKLQLFSENWLPEANSDIYVVNAFGKTPLFCQTAKVAYIGKSMFKEAKGGHNLLEAMQNGVVAIFGPYMDNFKEISKLAIQKKAAIEVQNPKELKKRLQNLLSNPQKLQNMGNNAKTLALAETVVKAKYLAIIEKFLLS